MNENAIQKCRTCLKNSTKIFPLTKLVRGCSGPKMTYAQLLKEYVKLECSVDYEHLMPQFLCLLCCRELRNCCNFIKQAQYCNSKLIHVISKKLDCLQEKIIDVPPPNKNDWVTPPTNIKVENDDVKDTTEDTEDKIVNLNARGEKVLLKQKLLKHSIIPNQDFDQDDDEYVNNDQNVLNDPTLERSATTDANATTIISNLTDKESESQNDTVCPICHKAMNRRYNLIAHMRTQHDIEAPTVLLPKINSESKEVFSCKMCSGQYTNKYTYIYHLKNKHGIDERNRKPKLKEKIIKCRSCEYTARTYAAMNYHTRAKHGTEKDKFKCKFCMYMCLKKFNLLTHVKNAHKEQIKVLKASEQGETLKDVISAKVNLTESKIVTLKEDNKENSLEENEAYSSDDNIPLALRILKSHDTPIFKSKIDDDQEEFSDEEFIRKILNIKKRQSKSTSNRCLARRCDECGNIYRNHKALYAHQRHVHISEDKYSLCPHCGKKYKRKTDLRIHIEKVHIPKNPNDNTKQPAKVREKRFMCTQCSYVCTTITILNIHINRHHTGEKPYKCDICFKSFLVPYDLKIHRYLHTGERPYKCPICSKGFRDNSHMIKHKRIHSSERPYKCKECGKSFTQSYNLSVHKRTHLKERKLNCGICGKVFENRALLNVHRINENHQDEIL